MTTSTFSLVISPPLFRCDVGHVGNAERRIAFHRAVDDVDGVGPQYRVGERRRPAFPVLDLVLPHAVDKVALVLRGSLREFLAEQFAAVIVHRHNRAAIKIGKRRTEIEDAGLKQRLLRGYRYLLIDVVCDPRLARLRYQRLAKGFQRFALMAIEKAERYVARPRLARRQQDFDAADREGQRTERRALYKTTPTNAFHGLLLPELCLYIFITKRWMRSITR